MSKRVTEKESEVPTVAVERRGQTADGRQFVELCVRWGGRACFRSFSTDALSNDDGASFLKWLAELGIPVVSRKRKTAAVENLQRQLDVNPGEGAGALVIDRTGWSREVFATHYRVHSPGDTDFLAAKPLDPSCPVEGVKHFRSAAKRYGRKNPLITFGICVGLSGPLLEYANLTELPLFVLVGQSSCGKSTLLKVARSIWGGPGNGLLGSLASLSATVNAAELHGLGEQDMLVAYDDLKTLPAHHLRRATDFHEFLFRSVSGRERGRLGCDPREWRTVFFAASNHPLSEILASGGLTHDDAVGSRAIEIRCDRKCGVFDYVPDAENASEYSKAMLSSFEACRGSAGEAFAAAIVKDRAKSAERLRKRIQRYVTEFVRRAAPTEAVGVNARILEKFGLAYAAGRLARRYKMVSWDKKWLTEALLVAAGQYRNGDARESTPDAPARLARYVADHGEALKTVWEGKPLKSERMINAARGVRYMRANGSSEYCFSEKQFCRIFKADEVRGAQRDLAAAGLLKADSGNGGKMHGKRRLVAGQRRRYCCIDRQALQRLRKGLEDPVRTSRRAIPRRSS